MEKTAPNLCQLHERSVPRKDRLGLYRESLFRDGKGALASIPSLDEAVRTLAGIQSKAAVAIECLDGS